MKTIFYSLLITITFTSCLTKKLPSNLNSFSGSIRTCILDSTSLTKEPQVEIINAEVFINADCPNKPKSYDYPMTWPSGIQFDFKANSYIFQHSAVPFDKTLEFTDHNFKILSDIDIGKIEYNAKKNTITLTSTKFKWTRSFKIKISDNRKTIFLTAINPA